MRKDVWMTLLGRKFPLVGRWLDSSVRREVFLSVQRKASSGGGYSNGNYRYCVIIITSIISESNNRGWVVQWFPQEKCHDINQLHFT